MWVCMYNPNIVSQKSNLITLSLQSIGEAAGVEQTEHSAQNINIPNLLQGKNVKTQVSSPLYPSH